MKKNIKMNAWKNNGFKDCNIQRKIELLTPHKNHS